MTKFFNIIHFYNEIRLFQCFDFRNFQKMNISGYASNNKMVLRTILLFNYDSSAKQFLQKGKHGQDKSVSCKCDKYIQFFYHPHSFLSSLSTSLSGDVLYGVIRTYCFLLELLQESELRDNTVHFRRICGNKAYNLKHHYVGIFLVYQ